MYIADLVSYNLQVFCKLAIAPLRASVEYVRKFYYVNITQMRAIDYHFKMLTTLVSRDSDSMLVAIAAPNSAKYLLLKMHTRHVADLLSANFNILMYLKSFAVDENIVSGYRMLNELKTLDDLIEMLIFLGYLPRRSIESALDAQTYANRKQIDICTFSEMIGGVA